MQTRLIEKIRALNVRIAPKHNVDAFGVVFDCSSISGDQPVALVIGINYGQRGTSGGREGIDCESIGYARHIAQLAQFKKLAESNYSVVLWNFFPYLTDTETQLLCLKLYIAS